MDLVVSPSVVGFNTQSGGHAQVLAPGQLIDALVLQLIDDTTVRLSVAGNIIDVKTQVPLQPGAAVRLAVRGHGNETRLVIVGQGAEPQSAPSESVPASPTILSVSDSATSSAQPSASQAAALGTEEAPASQPLPQKEAPPLAPSAPTRDVDPTVALNVATRAAAARQTGLAPLFAEAAVAAQTPGVPAAVQKAAQQLLALQAPFTDAPTPQAVEKAINSSGVFLEARLAAAASGRALAVAPALTAGGDLKAVLFTLREVLKNWLDGAAAPSNMPDGGQNDVQAADTNPLLAAQTRADERTVLARALTAEVKSAPPPLPYRDAPTAGQHAATPAVGGDAPPKLIGMALLDETDGAIARTTLLQAASLSSAPAASADRADGAATHWNLEIPFMTSQGTAIAQFEIVRDGRKGAAAAQGGVQGWRVNFSVDVEPMGPVHAQVALTGHRAAVRLWAERSTAATALRNSVGELNDALRQAALEPSEVLVRDGAPPRPLKPGAGRFVDRAS